MIAGAPDQWARRQASTCRQAKRIARGCVVTKSLDDLGTMQGLPQHSHDDQPAATQIMRIPALLLCYWMGATELSTDQQPGEAA